MFKLQPQGNLRSKFWPSICYLCISSLPKKAISFIGTSNHPIRLVPLVFYPENTFWIVNSFCSLFADNFISFHIFDALPLYGTSNPFNRFIHSFADYLFCVFSKITLFPFNVCRNTILLFRYHFSEKGKKKVFYPQMLLIISGSVEPNPGRATSEKKHLPLLSETGRPARNFEGIPLIESLQNTFDFNMFGVCESTGIFLL